MFPVKEGCLIHHGPFTRILSKITDCHICVQKWIHHSIIFQHIAYQLDVSQAGLSFSPCDIRDGENHVDLASRAVDSINWPRGDFSQYPNTFPLVVKWCVQCSQCERAASVCVSRGLHNNRISGAHSLTALTRSLLLRSSSGAAAGESVNAHKRVMSHDSRQIWPKLIF